MPTETANFVETTYRRHIDAIYRFCLWRTNSHHDAEDAATAVFVKVLVGKADNIDPRKLLGWLLSAADNECKTLLRKRQRQSEAPLENWMETVTEAEHPWISPEMCAAVSRLRPTAKRVVFLKTVQDLTFRETAVVLGVSEGAVKMVFYRAIKRLAKLLREGEGHDSI